MICVECKNPNIQQLYTELKSKYIQMTVCPECGKLADKYIEFDNVILFLDVLLLKPQAYRHLAYNVVEDLVFSNKGKLTFLERYKHLLRYALLTILFEVYLNWAFEEKHETRSTIVENILQKPVPVQYLFFIYQQLAERIVLCMLIDWCFRTFLGWGNQGNKNLPPSLQRGYFVSVLLLTIFMSLSIKCIPIIMLIWPYDNHIMAAIVVDILGLINTIEALRINVGASFIRTSMIVLGATLILILFRKVAISGLLAYFSDNSMTHLFVGELALWNDEASAVKSFFSSAFSTLESASWKSAHQSQ